MLPVPQDPTNSPQALQTAPGFFSRLGARVSGAASRITAAAGAATIGFAASRATRPLNARSVQILHSSCGRLIEDISNKTTEVILKKVQNTFVEGGSDTIQKVLADLTLDVFTVFATEGIDEGQELTDDQLADHFLCSILRKIINEFQQKPNISTKEHFKNIADNLLHAAYPDGINDKNIPWGLRNVLKGGLLSQVVIYFNFGADQDLSWNGLRDLFAEHLEQNYNALINLEQKAPSELDTPGANDFIQFIVSSIDEGTKKTSDVSVAIPTLSNDSNSFINKFLTRLLRNQVTRQEDGELLGKSRAWLLNHIETSLQALYATIFACEAGQTPEERRAQFANHITTQASKFLPQANREFKRIDAMDREAVVARLLEYKQDPNRKFHHTQIDNALSEIRINHEAIETHKNLLKSITAFLALEELLKKELNEEKLQPLLPPIFSATTVFNWIYSVSAPYLVEIITQFDATDHKGLEAKQALENNGAVVINGWIDSALAATHSTLEAKAEANTLNPSDLVFINDFLCTILRPAALPSDSEAKTYIDSQLKNLIAIIIEKAVRAHGGLENPEKAIAEIIDTILARGQQATYDLLEAKKASHEEKRATARRLAEELCITLKVDALSNENLEASFEALFMAKACRVILAGVISKELFNSLLPSFLRNWGFYEYAADWLSSYLKGISLQAEKIQALIANKELTLQVPELKDMLGTISTKALEALKAPALDPESSYEKLKNHVFQGKALQSLVENAMPRIVEAFVAYHVNPQEGLTSQKRTANLFMQFVTIAQKSLDKVDAYEQAENKASWLLANGYSAAILEEYRKKHDIKVHSVIDIPSFLLHEASENLLAVLLPKDLLTKFIPEQFAVFKLDLLLANFCYDYVRDAYNYSTVMKQLISHENEPQQETLIDLQKYLEAQVGNYFDSNASKEKSWLEELTRLIFTTEEPEQKALLLKFTTSIYFGALGYIIKNAQSLPGSADGNATGNLVRLFEPIAAHTQNTFIILNNEGDDASKLEALGISPNTIADYLRANGKEQNDYQLNQVAYWAAGRKALDVLFTDEAWNERVPAFLHHILTKDRAANFTTSVYETIHTTQVVLQREEQLGLARVRQEPGLEAFAEEYFTKNILETLQELGNDPSPLSQTLPTLLDSFLKECCKDDSTKVGEIRDTVIRRLLYSIMGKLLSDSTPIIKNATALINSYKKGDKAQTADLLLQTCLPKEILETPLVKLIVSKLAKNEIADCITQIQQSEKRLQNEASDAKTYLNSLKGMKPFIQDIMDGLDESLLKLAQDKNNKLSDDFPPFIDELLKEAILTPELQPIVKQFLHNFVYIIAEELLTPKLGQTLENRVLEVSAQFLALYNAENSQKMGAEWLKLLIPEARLKGLLPEFLQKVVTHEKLIKWFFDPYVQQVTDTQKKVAAENAKPTDPNIDRAQNFIQNTLLEYTKPTATTHGLFGFTGVVRELERTILGTLDGKNKDLGQATQNYLKATVSQITRTLEAAGVLDKNFVSVGLLAAFEHIETPQADLPSDKDFPASSAAKVLSLVFPEGKKSLLVPDVAKDIVWEKAEKAIKEFFEELLNPNMRILWAMNRIIPMTSGNETLVGKRLQEVEDMRLELLAGKPFEANVAEAAFKRYTVEAAVRQVELSIEKEPLWGPFKWIKTAVVKLLTYLAVRFSLRNRIYSFVASPASNEKIRRFIWSFITQQKSSADSLQDVLKQQTKATLAKQGLAPVFLDNIIASQFTTWCANKNIIDLLT